MKRSKIVIITVLMLLSMISGAFAFKYFNDKDDNLYFQVKDDYSYVPAQNRMQANDQITLSRNNLITETVKQVSPAVVGITVTEIRQVQDPFYQIWGNDPFWKQFFGDRSYNQEVKNLGSGTIISPDGYILTNDHVAGNAKQATITMTNGKHYNARIIGTDQVSDICLLKIDDKDLPYIRFGNSEDVMIGEWVVALGNPFGLFEINDQPTVTVGVLSAKGMNLDPYNNRYYLGMLQTDAAINVGNSGGPLVNSVGELIGMNTLIYSAGTQGNIGLGFAIPINKVKNIIEELKEKGSVDRNFWIGLSAQSIDERIAKYYKLSTARGVIVTNVERSSPAHKAGIEVGDIITDINNFRINNYGSLVGAFQEFRTNQNITLKLIRENGTLTKTMKLEPKYD